MSKSAHKQEPALPGENPTQDHRIGIEFLGQAYFLNRRRPSYMPNTEPELINWIRQYTSTAHAKKADFPAVFGGTSNSTFSVSVLEGMLSRIDNALGSLGVIPGVQRGITAYKNILLYNHEHGPVTAPRAEPNMVPPETAPSNFSGLVGIIMQQVDLLIQQPGYNQAIGRQFGIIPTERPSVDPATFDPQATARSTGGVVVITARSPRGLRGVDMLEIKCDRGSGVVEMVGTTTHATFTDHHDLPERRTHWIYYVNYIDRNGVPVGIQSVVDILVQSMTRAS